MTIRLLSGDARDVLPTLPAESVQCVVTSPPYWNLRDYGTALWAGGDAGCDHSVPRSLSGSTLMDAGRERIGLAPDHKYATERNPFRDTCGKCGAVRVDRQIGLEATPDAYIRTMVGVFREVRRVMRNDAVAFINMGDSYSDKQLLLMPARLALALQQDGWWVRSDIIWHKPNPMPESVTDRCVSAHEHVFMLTKAPRYYFDNEAIREPASTTAEIWESKSANWRNGTAKQQQRGDTYHPFKDAKPFENGPNPAGRSCRNVWTIATHSFAAAHFATFPPELAERCIKAGTSERGCCAVCGAPWRRVTETYYTEGGPNHTGNAQSLRYAQADGTRLSSSYKTRHDTTTGWAPGCDHDAPAVPCAVLDPFAGAGTTLLVADRLQRDAVGIELNVAYTEMAMERCRQDAPLFTSFAAAEPPEDERMADLFAGDEYERGPAVVSARTPFRTGAAYVNQHGLVSNGSPEDTDMAAD